MSLRLLEALLARKTIIHTALDDLESFLWVLIWGIVHASKDIEGAKTANPGIKRILSAWSGDLTCNISKQSAAENGWYDVVFGGLIRNWLGIFRKANDDEANDLMDYLPRIPLDNQKGSEWSRVCDLLESRFMKVYKRCSQVWVQPP